MEFNEQGVYLHRQWMGDAITFQTVYAAIDRRRHIWRLFRKHKDLHEKSQLVLAINFLDERFA